MGKKKRDIPRRSDADRRVRQCERLGRVLRTLQLLLGAGRWDVPALAQELECSQRTVQRILQTLQMAGVPFHYDHSLKAYRVQAGFRFPGLDRSDAGKNYKADTSKLRETTDQLLADGERFLKALRKFSESLDN